MSSAITGLNALGILRQPDPEILQLINTLKSAKIMIIIKKSERVTDCRSWCSALEPTAAYHTKLFCDVYAISSNFDARFAVYYVQCCVGFSRSRVKYDYCSFMIQFSYSRPVLIIITVFLKCICNAPNPFMIHV